MGKKGSNHKEDLVLLDKVKGILTPRQDPGSLPIQEVDKDTPTSLVTRSDPSMIVWERKSSPSVVTKRACIVIDQNNIWHEKAMVDLKGMEANRFTWGYYGKYYPVLVQGADGKLNPWYYSDAAGENSSYLYLAENPEGYKNTFSRKYPLLEKIRIGLMVTLLIALFFILYLLAEAAGGN